MDERTFKCGDEVYVFWDEGDCEIGVVAGFQGDKVLVCTIYGHHKVRKNQLEFSDAPF